MTSMKRCLSWAVLPLAALVFTLSAPVGAQQENADSVRAARQREALRRSQEALKQAQEQQAVLAHEKAQLATEKAKLDDDARRQGSQLGSARSQATKLRAEVSRLMAEQEVQRSAASAGSADKQATAAASAELKQRLEKADRELAERTRMVAALSTLTERSNKALSAAEDANRQMHVLGLQLIEQLRAASRSDSVFALRPVIGFNAVKLENEAEALRDKLDALKLPKAGAGQ